MSKLPKKYQFFDFSDYGRSPGHWLANRLKNTILTPIHVTTMFVVVGIFAIFLILNQYYITAAFFIIIKSILDAADGELSRLKKTPSYVGRYYDSIADILLNFCFLLSFWYISNNSISIINYVNNVDFWITELHNFFFYILFFSNSNICWY